MTTLEAPRVPATPEGRGRAVGWRTAGQLARVEARRLARHPVIWGAVLLAALMTIADLSGMRWVLPRTAINLQLTALPIGAATLLATHLATTRPRRDDVAELLEPAVQGRDTRVLALLLAAMTPVVITTVFVAVVLGTLAAFDAVGPVLWAEAATTPAIVAAAALLGVLLGRVAPWRLTPLFALVAVVVFQFLLAPGSPLSASVVVLFAPIVETGTAWTDATALLRPAALHLVYVLGASAVMAALAMLAGRITVRRVLAAVVALIVTATAGIAQVREPAGHEVDAVLAGVGAPAEAGECVADGTGAQVCALPMYLGWRDGWAAVVRAVREPLVERGVDPGPLTVAQRTDPTQATYELSRWFDPAEVDEAGHIETAWGFEAATPPGTVIVTSAWPRGSDGADLATLELATQVARQATGLPGGFVVTEDEGSVTAERVCVTDGQARAPVTLWLAAQVHAGADRALRRAAGEAAGTGRPSVDLWTPAVAWVGPGWSLPDVEVALQLLDRPHDEVANALAADWDRWTGASSTVRELVDEFGLDLPRLADQLPTQPGEPASEPDADGSLDLEDPGAVPCP